MSIYDVNYKLATAVTVTGSVNGSDVSIAQAGSLEGLRNGLLIEAKMIISGAIADPNSDGTLQVFIEEKIGSNYRELTCFPIIGSAQDTNVAAASSGQEFKSYFVVHYNATAVRYRTVLGGSGVRSYTGMDIYLQPNVNGPAF